MTAMINDQTDSANRQRLHQELETQNLDFLALLQIPTRGLEGSYLEVGLPGHGTRAVVSREVPGGRYELHWSPEECYSEQRGLVLLAQLESSPQPMIAEQLHSSVCQSLTAAHLHLELGLMSHPELSDFQVARELIHQVNGSVRDLMDSLAGDI